LLLGFVGVIIPVGMLTILPWVTALGAFSAVCAPILGLFLRTGLYDESCLNPVFYVLQSVLIAPLALPFLVIEFLVRSVVFCVRGGAAFCRFLKQRAAFKALCAKYEHQVTTCSITIEAITNPVVAPCGHFFEKHAIEEWLEKNQNCPVGRQDLTADQLTPVPVH
jgi:hypothetical protein